MSSVPLKFQWLVVSFVIAATTFHPLAWIVFGVTAAVVYVTSIIGLFSTEP